MGILDQINLNYLRIFLVVYRTRSMTLAAKELHLTQSGVSQQIKALEENLGITLFDRVNRKIIPTHDAEVLFNECSAKLEDLEHTLINISQRTHELTGVIKIGFPPIFGYYILLPLLARFARENPQVQFELRMGLATEIVDLLENGGLDFAFLDAFAKNPHLVTENVFLEYLDLCCHKSILERFPNYEFSLKYFRTLPYIGYLAGEPILRLWFQQNFNSLPHNLNVVATIVDSNSIARLIAEGLGVGLLPEVLIRQLNQTDIHKFKSTSRVANHICVCYLDKRTMGDAAKRCFDWLKKNIPATT